MSEPYYRLHVQRDPDEPGYMVTNPKWPGLSAFGNTADEAIAQGEVALGLFIETCRDKGIPLPEPDIEHDDNRLGCRTNLEFAEHGGAVVRDYIAYCSQCNESMQGDTQHTIDGNDYCPNCLRTVTHPTAV